MIQGKTATARYNTARSRDSAVDGSTRWSAMPKPTAATLGRRKRGPLAEKGHEPPDQGIGLDVQAVGADADVGQDAVGRLSKEEHEEGDVAEDIAAGTSSGTHFPSPFRKVGRLPASFQPFGTTDALCVNANANDQA